MRVSPQRRHATRLSPNPGLSAQRWRGSDQPGRHRPICRSVRCCKRLIACNRVGLQACGGRAEAHVDAEICAGFEERGKHRLARGSPRPALAGARESRPSRREASLSPCAAPIVPAGLGDRPTGRRARTIAPRATHKLGHAARRARRADGCLCGATSPGGVPVVRAPQQSGLLLRRTAGRARGWRLVLHSCRRARGGRADVRSRCSYSLVSARRVASHCRCRFAAAWVLCGESGRR